MTIAAFVFAALLSVAPVVATPPPELPPPGTVAVQVLVMVGDTPVVAGQVLVPPMCDS